MTTQTPDGPPETRVAVVEETLHGQEIRDPYRWLEDENDPETEAWVAAQNAYTESRLAARPERAAFGERLAELLAVGTVSAPVERGGRYFYTRREGAQDQPVLYVREGLDGPDRPLVDPNSASADSTVALDWWHVAEDGALVCYGFSDHGDEKSTLYVIDVTTGALLPDVIPRTRACSVAWEPDRAGFYYTRYPAPGTVPEGEEGYHRHVFHHTLGADPETDPELFGAGRDMTDWPSVDLSPDGRRLLVLVDQGWTRTQVYVRDVREPDGAFRLLSEGIDALFGGQIVDDALFLHTNWRAPRWRALRVDLAQPEAENWREIVPERPDVVIEMMTIAGGRLALGVSQDVVSRVEIYTLGGAALPAPPLPPLGSLTALHGRAAGDELFLGFESYTTPPTIFRYDLASGAFSAWAAVVAPVDLRGIEVRQTRYTSRDGTPVPLFIIGRRDLPRDGTNPTVLNGYGGFNLSRGPVFTRDILAWLERGGIYAVANLRGGSEFGEEWHRAGMRGQKQNVFDDFHAAAEYLIAEGYTRPERLAITGRSNGGLLVGAALTQRPDLYRAVVCQVPLLDMIRFPRFRIARLWTAEYGSPDVPEEFAWLWAYSPYHHVRAGVEYPATLFTTGDSDSRVDPLHARKMTALLQSLHPRRPVLLRVDVAAGHGAGKPLSKLVEEQRDIWTFLAWQLGLDPEAPAAKTPEGAAPGVAERTA
jgi:prolyl oligopeptidase